MNTRYECISSQGISTFYSDRISNVVKVFSYVILDHQEKCVLKHRDENYPGSTKDEQLHAYEHACLSSHISSDIRKRLDLGTPLSLEEWKELKCNTYERMHLVPLYPLEVLLIALEKSIANCALMHGVLPTTYEEAVIHSYVPALIAKMKNRDSTVEYVDHVFNCAKL